MASGAAMVIGEQLFVTRWSTYMGGTYYCLHNGDGLPPVWRDVERRLEEQLAVFKHNNNITETSPTTVAALSRTQALAWMRFCDMEAFRPDYIYEPQGEDRLPLHSISPVPHPATDQDKALNRLYRAAELPCATGLYQPDAEGQQLLQALLRHKPVVQESNVWRSAPRIGQLMRQMRAPVEFLVTPKGPQFTCLGRGNRSIRDLTI